MAQKRRFLDVWIVESDTVYREVPYEVVTDWVQQGRLLDDDMLRWSGQAEWFRLGSTPAFKAYMPRVEADRAEDQAEALEPVHVDFTWKRPRDEGDDEVDMIPLIDISLVLLVYFMFLIASITTSRSSAPPINTPPAVSGYESSDPELYWVSVQYGADQKTLIYMVGKGSKILGGDDRKDQWRREVPNTDAEQAKVLNEIVQTLQQQPGLLEVNIKAGEDVPSGLVRDLTRKLEGMRGKVRKKFIGVSEKNR
jgi:biopolymer transport protein ExbD